MRTLPTHTAHHRNRKRKIDRKLKVKLPNVVKHHRRRTRDTIRSENVQKICARRKSIIFSGNLQISVWNHSSLIKFTKCDIFASLDAAFGETQCIYKIRFRSKFIHRTQSFCMLISDWMLDPTYTYLSQHRWPLRAARNKEKFHIYSLNGFCLPTAWAPCSFGWVNEGAMQICSLFLLVLFLFRWLTEFKLILGLAEPRAGAITQLSLIQSRARTNSCFLVHSD